MKKTILLNNIRIKWMSSLAVRILPSNHALKKGMTKEKVNGFLRLDSKLEKPNQSRIVQNGTWSLGFYNECVDGCFPLGFFSHWRSNH
jgi:hypothetical protein